MAFSRGVANETGRSAGAEDIADVAATARRGRRGPGLGITKASIIIVIFIIHAVAMRTRLRSAGTHMIAVVVVVQVRCEASSPTGLRGKFMLHVKR